MSDIPKKFLPRYVTEDIRGIILQGTPNSHLSYVRRQIEERKESFCWIEIPMSLLICWETIYRYSSEFESFVSLLNQFIPGAGFSVCGEAERIEERLRSKCCSSYNNFKSLKGRKKQEYASQSFKMNVFVEEVLSLDDVKTMHDHILEENFQMEEEIEKLHMEMTEELKKRDKMEEKLFESNEQLEQYVRKLERYTLLPEKNGKDISTLSPTTKWRYLKELKTRAQKALWFMEQFGLNIQTLEVKQNDGVQQFIDLTKSGAGSDSTSHLPDDKDHNIEKVLFLMDKFCVSEDFYHELSMVFENLPRSYLVKNCKHDLNKQCHLTKTPGEAPGVQRSFLELLREHISELKNEREPNEPVKVKVSTDGALMSRNANYLMISFSILQKGEEVMSSKGNHTIAVVQGAENYDTLKDSFKEVFKEINDVQECGSVSVNGQNVPVELFLGGDYKILLLIMGLSGATSNFSCLWCTIHKNNRYDMSKADTFYESSPQRRTLDDLKRWCKKKGGKNFCCIHPPLLNIPLDHIILDELHLLLRVTDVLTRNIIDEMIEWDDEDAHKNKVKNPVPIGKHLQKAIDMIRECGVSFHVWEKKNADGKGSGTYDWTSLMGNEKKKLLKFLPGRFSSFLRKETATTIEQIWKDFERLYSESISLMGTVDVTAYCKQAKDWINLFCSLGKKRTGYSKKNVTCYMHAMVYHVPAAIKRHGNVKKFTGQGVEKNNDDARKVVRRKSNNWDSPADVLRTEFRLWNLRERERVPRQYNKRKAEYWNSDIIVLRSKRRRVSKS